MNDMYYKAKMAWGVAMPVQLKQLKNRDDEHVIEALQNVLGDITSDNWKVDSKIAWAIMQGRDVT